MQSISCRIDRMRFSNPHRIHLCFELRLRTFFPVDYYIRFNLKCDLLKCWHFIFRFAVFSARFRLVSKYTTTSIQKHIIIITLESFKMRATKNWREQFATLARSFYPGAWHVTPHNRKSRINCVADDSANAPFFYARATPII